MALFEKGQSGNPGGRPKEDPIVKQLAKEHGPKAIETLARLLIEGDDRIKVQAANALLDRGFGKPKQEVEHSGPDGVAALSGIVVKFVRPDAES